MSSKRGEEWYGFQVQGLPGGGNSILVRAEARVFLSAKTYRRHRMLFDVWLCRARSRETFENWLVNGLSGWEAEDAIAFLRDEVQHPYWESWTNVQFAQEVYGKAFGWDPQEEDELLPTKKAFLEWALEWGKESDYPATAPLYVEMAKAALAFDIPRVIKFRDRIQNEHARLARLAASAKYGKKK